MLVEFVSAPLQSDCALCDIVNPTDIIDASATSILSLHRHLLAELMADGDSRWGLTENTRAETAANVLKRTAPFFKLAATYACLHACLHTLCACPYPCPHTRRAHVHFDVQTCVYTCSHRYIQNIPHALRSLQAARRHGAFREFLSKIEGAEHVRMSIHVSIYNSCLWLYIRVCTCPCAYLCACVCACLHTCLCSCLCTCLHPCLHDVYARVYIHVYAH